MRGHGEYIAYRIFDLCGVGISLLTVMLNKNSAREWRGTAISLCDFWEK
jgi:hypothetical protein